MSRRADIDYEADVAAHGEWDVRCAVGRHDLKHRLETL